MNSFVGALRANDNDQLKKIFGPEGDQLLSSGDPVADQEGREELLALYDDKHELVEGSEPDAPYTLLVGESSWPFPIPVMKKGDSWVFDIARGREEILNRRIGENELYTIQVCRAIVDAQREYAMKDRDKNGLLEYAQKFRSDPGKKNGLYWDSKAGEPQSPLGPITVRARGEGYQGRPSNSPSPYHGYYFRLLTAQGKDAPSGARSYLWRGKMIFGFALIAYPAEYGNSGVMSFIVNHDGNVFQKNLGANTAAIARSMKEYNPDKTWTAAKP